VLAGGGQHSPMSEVLREIGFRRGMYEERRILASNGDMVRRDGDYTCVDIVS
jgi:hypothetical protein